MGSFFMLSDLFPGEEASEKAFRRIIARLDQVESIKLCIKINTLLSDPQEGYTDDVQTRILNLLEKYGLLNIDNAQSVRLTRRHHGNFKTLFGRPQLLELIQSLLAFGGDNGMPPGTMLGNRDFLRASLMAYERWSKRLQSPASATMLSEFDILPIFREASLWYTLPIGRYTFVGFSQRLILEHFFKMFPDYAIVFEELTGLTPRTHAFCGSILIGQLMRAWEQPYFDLQQDNLALSISSTWAGNPESREKWEKFIALRAGDFTEFKNVFTNLNSDASKQVDLRPFLNKPLLKVTSDSVMIVDLALLGESLSHGPVFHLAANKQQGKDPISDFGKAFESFSHEHLEHLYRTGTLSNALNAPIRNPSFSGSKRGEEIADSAIIFEAGTVLVEMKGSWVNNDAMYPYNPQKFWQEIRKKYVEESGTKKGIGQLARSVAELASGRSSPNEWCFDHSKPIYPLLLVYDNHMTTLEFGTYLAREFTEQLCIEHPEDGYFLINGTTVHLPIVISSNDLEDLEQNNQEISFIELLKQYSLGFPTRSTPFADVVVKNANILQQGFLLTGARELLEHARAWAKGQESQSEGWE